MRIRPDTPADVGAVTDLLHAAFAGPDEARIVTALRGRVTPLVSLVAEDDGRVVGHILFSPVTLDGSPHLPMMGLAPMAVAPARQRQGIGSALVRAGLEACRSTGSAAVVVVGHPAYYPRFGFVPASRVGLTCEYDVPDEVFMALELQPGALAGHAGRARFHDAFGAATV
ncbi:MAG: GNAT family N-acetyltransferase [Vicinamibacterales bacterium]